jgi:hypothetical protein
VDRLGPGVLGTRALGLGTSGSPPVEVLSFLGDAACGFLAVFFVAYRFRARSSSASPLVCLIFLKAKYSMVATVAEPMPKPRLTIGTRIGERLFT